MRKFEESPGLIGFPIDKTTWTYTIQYPDPGIMFERDDSSVEITVNEITVRMPSYSFKELIRNQDVYEMIIEQQIKEMK
jgi:hypothetical protein